MDITNILTHVGGLHSEYLDHVREITNTLNEQPDFDFIITGHSLGGRLAAAASRLTGKHAIVFNAAGLDEEVLELGERATIPCDVVHYAVEGELLTALQDELRPDSPIMRKEGQSLLWDLISSISRPYRNRTLSGESVGEWCTLLSSVDVLMTQLTETRLKVPAPIEDLPRQELPFIHQEERFPSLAKGWLETMIKDIMADDETILSRLAELLSDVLHRDFGSFSSGTIGEFVAAYFKARRSETVSTLRNAAFRHTINAVCTSVAEEFQRAIDSSP